LSGHKISVVLQHKDVTYCQALLALYDI